MTVACGTGAGCTRMANQRRTASSAITTVSANMMLANTAVSRNVNTC